MSSGSGVEEAEQGEVLAAAARVLPVPPGSDAGGRKDQHNRFNVTANH